MARRLTYPQSPPRSVRGARDCDEVVPGDSRRTGQASTSRSELATGYGPCRLCLQTFHEGTEERLLFTYQPFTDRDALPAPGPVFIHRRPWERYDVAELPDALRPLPLVLEGYGASGTLLTQRRVGTSRFESILDGVFESAEVHYAHLRNAEAGCFIARVDRG